MRLPVVAVVAVLAGTVASLADLSAERRAQAATVADSEAYAVYASLIPDEWIVQMAHAKKLVIQEETEANLRLLPAGKPLEGPPWREVVDAFKAANRNRPRLLPGRDLGRPYIVVLANAIGATFKEVPDDPLFGWTGFYRRYPDSGGFVQLSAVGFDRRKQRALVYIAHHCGSLCGGGSHHFLEKVQGVWRKARIPGLVMTVWMS